MPSSQSSNAPGLIAVLDFVAVAAVRDATRDRVAGREHGGRLAVAVAVGVDEVVDGRRLRIGLVDLAVAVVVDVARVAELVLARVDRGQRVVAVAGARCVAADDLARHDRRRARLAVAVAVVVDVPGEGRRVAVRFVDVAVAVVVDVVGAAELGLGGVHGTGVVVAIDAVQDVALGRDIEAGVRRRGVQVAVRVVVGVRPVVELERFGIGIVDEPVAVVVERRAVAHLEHVRIDRRVGVVAVVGIRGGARGLVAGHGPDRTLLAVAVPVRVRVEGPRVRWNPDRRDRRASRSPRRRRRRRTLPRRPDGSPRRCHCSPRRGGCTPRAACS